MKSNVKERLISYLNYKGVSYSEFGRIIGVSNAYVTSIRKSIQPDKIQGIALNYQDLNINWLLTGEGSMLREENSPPNTAEEKLWTLIKEKDAKIEELSKQIGKLEAIIDSLNAKKSHPGGAVDAICAAAG